jgi:Uma2 family endonuclease
MATVIGQQEKLITGEEFATMPGPKRLELVRGRIGPMTPPPGFEHGTTETRLGGQMDAFVQARKLSEVAGGEVGVYTSRNPDTVRGVDILFISHDQLAKRDKNLKYLDVAPELIVEIRSPSNTEPALAEKLAEYFAIGVKLVWVADPATRTVRVYRSLTEMRVLSDDDDLSGEDILPGFLIPVAKIFR